MTQGIYCARCGFARGDMSKPCAGCAISHNESDRDKMKDTVFQGDRERSNSIKSSFRGEKWGNVK